VSKQVASTAARQRQTQTQTLLMQVPAPNFPWATHENTQLAVHALPSHVGGGPEQLPPTHAEPPPQSASVQHAKAQTQLFACLV
jgi:hypothetical protein